MRLTFLLLAAALAAGMPAPAAAQQDRAAACAREFIASDLEAKIVYQTAQRDIIVAAGPRFRDLAGLNMDLQIALARARAAQAAYLLQHDPGRLKIGEAMQGYRSYAWSDAEDDALAGEDSSYAGLRDTLATLKPRNDAHPDWPAMRALFRDSVMRGNAHSQALASFSGEQNAIAKKLADCLN